MHWLMRGAHCCRQRSQASLKNDRSMSQSWRTSLRLISQSCKIVTKLSRTRDKSKTRCLSSALLKKPKPLPRQSALNARLVKPLKSKCSNSSRTWLTLSSKTCRSKDRLESSQRSNCLASSKTHALSLTRRVMQSDTLDQLA